MRFWLCGMRCNVAFHSHLSIHFQAVVCFSPSFCLKNILEILSTFHSFNISYVHIFFSCTFYLKNLWNKLQCYYIDRHYCDGGKSLYISNDWLSELSADLLWFNSICRPTWCVFSENKLFLLIFGSRFSNLDSSSSLLCQHNWLNWFWLNEVPWLNRPISVWEWNLSVNGIVTVLFYSQPCCLFVCSYEAIV